MNEEQANKEVAAFPPGFWRDEAGALHVDLKAFLEANGIPVTPQTQAVLEASLRQSFTEAYPGVQVDVVDWGRRE